MLPNSPRIIWLVSFASLLCLGTRSSAQTFSVIHSGGPVVSSLVVSGTSLYGTTEVEGNPTKPGNGTIFTLNTDGTGYHVLYSFSGNADGAQPNNLLLSGDTLFGITSFPPFNVISLTTLFRVKTNGTQFQVLKTFSGNGQQRTGSWAGPLAVSAGVLYGTTVSASGGSLFRMNFDGTRYLNLKQFDEGAPHGNVLVAGDRIYGLVGTSVYSIGTNGTGYSILHDFWLSGEGGRTLTLSGSTLYGTGGEVTCDSGNGISGSIFQMTATGDDFRSVHCFSEFGGPGGSALLIGDTFYGTVDRNVYLVHSDGMDYAVINSPIGRLGDNLIYSRGTLYGWTVDEGNIFALSLAAPTLIAGPKTQTAELGSTLQLVAKARTAPGVRYQWFFDETNFLGTFPQSTLSLTNLSQSQAGLYTLVITTGIGAVTSAPAQLAVIPAVPRQDAVGISLDGQPGGTLNLEYSETMPSTQWRPLPSLTVSNSSGYYFDPAGSLSPQKFYRASFSDTSNTPGPLNLAIVPAIVLSGNPGDSLRLDYINRFGPIDAWTNVTTVKLPQPFYRYFDVSAIGRPERLYRIVPVP